MPSHRDQSSSTAWQIHARFTIEAGSEQEAQRALRAIERAAARASASVTIHVHASEGQDAVA